MVVHVPVSVLLDPDLTATVKVIWMARCLQPTAGPAQLEGLTGLSRHSVLSGLGHIKAYPRAPRGPRVKVPGALLAARGVGAQAKVLYGLLQATPAFRGQQGRFTYASLCELSRLSRNALKRAMADLTSAGWVRTAQANRRSPIDFDLPYLEAPRPYVEEAVVKRRLQRAQNGGEAIMQEYLSLLIESDQFTDNARPGFLVNPLTGERLELDRFYPPNVGFEFHGAQHDGATDRFSQAEADAQHLRDIIKAGLCVYQGIHLVIIRAEDLSLQGIVNKIPPSLPRRSLAGHERLIDLLEDAGLRYCAAAKCAPQGARNV